MQLKFGAKGVTNTCIILHTANEMILHANTEKYIFKNQNHQDPVQAWFSGTHHYQETFKNHSHHHILQKNHRIILRVHPPHPFCTLENAVYWPHSTVHQSENFQTLQQPSEYTQVPSFLSILLSMMMKGLQEAVWQVCNQQTQTCLAVEMKCFCKCHSDSEWCSIQPTVSWTQCSLQGTSETQLLLQVFCTSTENFCKKICTFVFHACARHSREALASSGKQICANFGENQKGCVVSSPLRKKSGTLKSHPYFQNALLIFMVFRNKDGGAVKVGMSNRAN